MGLRNRIMDIRIVTTAIVLLLLVVGLSGCTQINDNTNTDLGNKVELVKWYNGTYEEVGKIMYNGFVYDESAKFYLVNGTARNIADTSIKTVIIHVKYYDINNTLLWDDGLLDNGIAPNKTWEFHSFYTKNQDHFMDVHHVEFDILGKLNE